MADRAQQLGRRAGPAAAGLVLCLTLGTLAAVAWRAEGAFGITVQDWAAIRFTLLQASLSALCSVALAVPVARALARRRFPGRSLLITLLGAPFILPVIVAVLGLLAVFGRNGLLNSALVWLGVEPLQIYGLHGIVLAHVFFNMPLATRLILQGWAAIPAERFRLAAALDFRPRDITRRLEYPMLRAVLPGAFAVIFLICTTSFAVALALGGGPRATTVELAIYQAFRFDFDLSRAAILAVIQFAIGAVAAALAYRVAVAPGFGSGLGRPLRIWGQASPAQRLTDTVCILATAMFLLTPLLMIVLDGLPGLTKLPETVLWAALRSIVVALCSTALALALALPMALYIQSARGKRRALTEITGYLSVSASPLVLGTGLYLILFPVADPVRLALAVTAVINAVMALPFALRAISPALNAIEADWGRLADSLDMRGGDRLRLLILPRLRRPLGFAAGLTAALSMGDLGVIALFAGPDQATLPLQLYRLMAAYRMQDAAAAALLLLGLSLTLFWVFDRGGRTDADA